MSKLDVGKIPIDVLNRTVMKMTGAPSRRLLAGPRAGVDFAAIRTEGGYMIISSDPITGISSGAGRYAVVVCANDVATSGNAPRFMESVVLLPEGSTQRELSRLASEMDAAARELGITIVGGHTEVTPGLGRPIVVATVFCFAKGFVSSEMAREGDAMLMTKTAGLEGTAALAREARALGRRLPARLARAAMGEEAKMSVVKDATAAYSTGRVHAMHDCTEGGVLGAAYEMSLASGLGFELDEGAVPVSPLTSRVCDAFSVDPLRLIGSGALLIAVPERWVDETTKVVGRRASVTRVGRFVASGRRLVRRDGTKERLRAAPVDELWRALGRPRRAGHHLDGHAFG